jgi:HSF-type DNA-binding
MPYKIAPLSEYSQMLESYTNLHHSFSVMRCHHVLNQTNRIFLTSQLWKILNDPQNSKIIQWLPDGLSFFIHRRGEFARLVLPKHFQRSAKYTSFTRKLSRWGFTRVIRGADAGAYYHRLFQRNRCELTLKMTRPIAVAKTHEKTKSIIYPAMSVAVEPGRSGNGTTASYFPVPRDSEGPMIPPNGADSSHPYSWHYQLQPPHPAIVQQSYSTHIYTHHCYVPPPHLPVLPQRYGTSLNIYGQDDAAYPPPDIGETHVQSYHPSSTAYVNHYTIDTPPPHLMQVEQLHYGPSSEYTGNNYVQLQQHQPVEYMHNRDEFHPMAQFEPSNKMESLFHPSVLVREPLDREQQYYQQHDNDQHPTNSCKPSF